MSEVAQLGLGVNEGQQMLLWQDDPIGEDADYLSQQLITYIGNKRALLGHIAKAVDRVKHRLGKTRLRVFDAFSGSGVVSRYLKAHASLLISNDFEEFVVIFGSVFNKFGLDKIFIDDNVHHAVD